MSDILNVCLYCTRTYIIIILRHVIAVRRKGRDTITSKKNKKHAVQRKDNRWFDEQRSRQRTIVHIAWSAAVSKLRTAGRAEKRSCPGAQDNFRRFVLGGTLAVLGSLWGARLCRIYIKGRDLVPDLRSLLWCAVRCRGRWDKRAPGPSKWSVVCCRALSRTLSVKSP